MAASEHLRADLFLCASRRQPGSNKKHCRTTIGQVRRCRRSKRRWAIPGRWRLPQIVTSSQKIGKENKPQTPNNVFDAWGFILLVVNMKEQIIGSQDKPQCLVVQRLLSHLQYLVCTKSSTKDLSPATINLGVVSKSRALSTMNQLMKSGRAYFFSCNVAVWCTALLSQHGFRLRGVQS